MVRFLNPKSKLSRNDPCWCGSGRKYKSCHLVQDRMTKDPSRHPTSTKIIIKSEEQIAGIRRSCQLVKQTLDMLTQRIEAGITTQQLDDWAHEFILDHGARPAPLNYKKFPKSICTSLNEVICHGIPDQTVLKDGDILNVDVTTILDGFYGDSSRMFMIGEPSPAARKLVEVTRECLYIGIQQVRPMNTVGDIGAAIQAYAEGHNFSVVRDYAGHGVGLKFHEDPPINHYGQRGSGPALMPNMVFTIEPMINLGAADCRVLADKWTAVTVDGSLSAQWEHTVRVTQEGVEILTD